MAEKFVATKPTVPKQEEPTSFKFDKDTLLVHLTAIQQGLEDLQGKPGYNPYLWDAKNIQPLMQRLVKVDASTAEDELKKLHDAVMALPLNPDVKAGPGPDKPLPPVKQAGNVI